MTLSNLEKVDNFQMTNPFWNFSLEVYSKKGVSDACIALQEKCGVDVNILLFCCWTASVGHPVLSKHEVTLLCRSAADWNYDIVQKLRSVRKSFKIKNYECDEEEVRQLQNQILEVEIKAEQIEQFKLMRTITVLENDSVTEIQRINNAVENISLYFSMPELSSTCHTSELLNLLDGVFSKVHKTDIKLVLEQT